VQVAVKIMVPLPGEVPVVYARTQAGPARGKIVCVVLL